jgi:glycosyltransferase involved in cell wall biosynthesis
VKPPTLSILMPSYNHGRFLPETIASVQSQTWTDWELIFVDDGSRDDSVTVARDLASGDPRISVHVNETNLGTYGTQERARSMANGAFIAVLNSDDRWAEDKLARQLELLRRYPDAPFCYTLGWKIDENSQVDTSEDVHADWPQDECQRLYPYLLFENRVLASSVLFRKEAVQFDPTLRYSGDWMALLGPARDAKVALVPQRLNFWRMHSHNTFVRSPKQVLEEIRVREGIAKLRPRDREERRGLGRNALNLAALEILRGRKGAAVAHAATALRLLPERGIALRRLASVLLPGARARLWPGDETTFNEN